MPIVARVIAGSRERAVSRIAEIAARWSSDYDRGAHDYTDEGCRVLAEAAFGDIAYLLERVRLLEGITERLVAAIDDLPVQSMTAHLADNHAGAKTALACAHHA